MSERREKILSFTTVVTKADTGLDVLRRLRDMQGELKNEVIRRGGEWFPNSIALEVEPVQGTPSYKAKVWTVVNDSE